MSDKKQIPGLPVATEAKDNDRLIKRDMDSGSDESLSVSVLLERSGEQVDAHATEEGGIHGIPVGERAMHSADQLSHRNKIINGNFDIWQRGTSFTISGSQYTADRWQTSGAGDGTFSRQSFALGQTDVPGEPQYYARLDRTSAATSANTPVYQRIEGVRSFAGQTATLSFYARFDTGKDFAVRSVQAFGSGGTPSANVTTVLGTITGTGLWEKYTLTTDVPSISGKTIGTNGDDFLQISIHEEASFSTFTIDIAQVQLEVGSVATQFEKRSIGEEMALCQRYYFATPGAFKASSVLPAKDAHRELNLLLPVRMRATPAITATYENFGTPEVIPNSMGVVFFTETAPSSNAWARILGFSADAEL